MNARYNGEKWVVEITAQQFHEMVERFFNRNPFPTCDELKDALVPSGVHNSAIDNVGRFGENGIFKFEFWSSDGIALMVKYHDIDPKVAENYPGNNAAIGWTAQIICDDCTYFAWDSKQSKARTIKVGRKKVEEGKAPKDPSAHIPLRSGPTIVAED